jgi:hypothetical protein
LFGLVSDDIGRTFKSRLPSTLMRAQLRQIDQLPLDIVLSDIFALDQMIKTALPPHKKFSYVSVVDAICPARQCALAIDGGIPLAWIMLI